MPPYFRIRCIFGPPKSWAQKKVYYMTSVCQTGLNPEGRFSQPSLFPRGYFSDGESRVVPGVRPAVAGPAFSHARSGRKNDQQNSGKIRAKNPEKIRKKFPGLSKIIWETLQEIRFFGPKKFPGLRQLTYKIQKKSGKKIICKRVREAKQPSGTIPQVPPHASRGCRCGCPCGADRA
jgi:hypothetical protein